MASQRVPCVTWTQALRLSLLCKRVEKPDQVHGHTCLWSVSASTSHAFSSLAQGSCCGRAPFHHHLLPSLLPELQQPAVKTKYESTLGLAVTLLAIQMPAQKIAAGEDFDHSVGIVPSAYGGSLRIASLSLQGFLIKVVLQHTDARLQLTDALHGHPVPDQTELSLSKLPSA